MHTHLQEIKGRHHLEDARLGERLMLIKNTMCGSVIDANELRYILVAVTNFRMPIKTENFLLRDCRLHIKDFAPWGLVSYRYMYGSEWN